MATTARGRSCGTGFEPTPLGGRRNDGRTAPSAGLTEAGRRAPSRQPVAADDDQAIYTFQVV